MRKRWRLWLGLGLAVAVLAVTGQIIRSRWLPPEPVYQGKPLSDWLPRAIMENSGGIHYNHDHYRDALAAAGSRAVPFILAKLRKNDSPLADRYRKLWPRLPALLKRFFPQPRPPDYFAQDAAAALMCLGTEAIPELVEAVDDSNPAVRQAAEQALCGFAGGALSDRDAARVFGQAIEDGDPGVRLFAAFALSRIGPAASNSVPALIKALSSSQTAREPGKVFFVHEAAASALAAIGRPAAPAIPVLTSLLPAADRDTLCAFTNAVHAIEFQLADKEKAVSAPIASVLPPTPSGKLRLWLKADAGVVTDAGGRVREWQDQSDNRNNAVQPCATSEPLLVFPPALAGRPALRFDGLPVFWKPNYGAGHCIAIGPYLKGAGQVEVPGAMTSFCVHMLAVPSSRELTLWAVGEVNPTTYGE